MNASTLGFAVEQPSPVQQLLSADDFWDRTGKQNQHELSDTLKGEIRRVAVDGQAQPSLRFRANKLACDLAGHTRLSPEIPAEAAARALGAAMKHLEANLADETVRKFSPQLGFSHLGVTLKSADDGAVWVLIETVEVNRSGGLNLRVDPATLKVTNIKHWGKVTPVAAP